MAPGRISVGSKSRTRDHGICNVLGENVARATGLRMGF